MIKKITKVAQKWILTLLILRNHLSMTDNHLWEIIQGLLKNKREFSKIRKNGIEFKDGPIN